MGMEYKLFDALQGAIDAGRLEPLMRGRNGALLDLFSITMGLAAHLPSKMRPAIVHNGRRLSQRQGFFCHDVSKGEDSPVYMAVERRGGGWVRIDPTYLYAFLRPSGRLLYVVAGPLREEEPTWPHGLP